MTITRLRALVSALQGQLASATTAKTQAAITAKLTEAKEALNAATSAEAVLARLSPEAVVEDDEPVAPARRAAAPPLAGEGESEEGAAAPTTAPTADISDLVDVIAAKLGPRVAAVLESRLALGEQANRRVKALEQTHAASAKSGAIAKALAEKRVTPHEAKRLQDRPAAYVEAFLEDRAEAVVVGEDTVQIPNPERAGAGQVVLNAEQLTQIEAACAGAAAAGMDVAKLRTELVAAAQKLQASKKGRF